MQTSFKTPVARRQDSVNSKLASTMKTHKTNYSPSIDSRVSTSPKAYKSYSDIKIKGTCNYQPMRKKVNRSELKLSTKIHFKPLSMSPRRFFKIPDQKSSEHSSEEETSHYKPYVQQSNKRERYASLSFMIKSNFLV